MFELYLLYNYNILLLLLQMFHLDYTQTPPHPVQKVQEDMVSVCLDKHLQTLLHLFQLLLRFFLLTGFLQNLFQKQQIHQVFLIFLLQCLIHQEVRCKIPSHYKKLALMKYSYLLNSVHTVLNRDKLDL